MGKTFKSWHQWSLNIAATHIIPNIWSIDVLVVPRLNRHELQRLRVCVCVVHHTSYIFAVARLITFMTVCTPHVLKVELAFVAYIHSKHRALIVNYSPNPARRCNRVTTSPARQSTSIQYTIHATHITCAAQVRTTLQTPKELYL